jgi:hypothetical protein
VRLDFSKEEIADIVKEQLKNWNGAAVIESE